MLTSSAESASCARGRRRSRCRASHRRGACAATSTSHSSKNCSLARRGGIAIGPRVFARRLAVPRRARSCRTPCRNRRPRRRSGRSRRFRASCRAASCPTPDLPPSGLQRRHLLRNLSHGGEHEPPGQLRRRVRRRVGVLVRRNDNAVSRAGVDVDVRIDAALADQPAAWAGARSAARGFACARGSAPELRRPASRCASLSMSWTWSFQIVTSWPPSLPKHASVRTVSK